MRGDEGAGVRRDEQGPTSGAARLPGPDKNLFARSPQNFFLRLLLEIRYSDFHHHRLALSYCFINGEHARNGTHSHGATYRENYKKNDIYASVIVSQTMY